jgi:hypothetical protein
MVCMQQAFRHILPVVGASQNIDNLAEPAMSHDPCLCNELQRINRFLPLTRTASESVCGGLA